MKVTLVLSLMLVLALASAAAAVNYRQEDQQTQLDQQSLIKSELELEALEQMVGPRRGTEGPGSPPPDSSPPLNGLFFPLAQRTEEMARLINWMLRRKLSFLSKKNEEPKREYWSKCQHSPLTCLI